MTAADRARALQTLLEKLRARHKPEPKPDDDDAPGARDQLRSQGPDGSTSVRCVCHGDRLLRLFLHSFLAWETTLAKADSALARIEASVVDLNELRVCMPSEIAEIVGHNLPRGEERAARLRTALNDVFKREHRLRLDHLGTKSKREARQYLDSLSGVPFYVSSRVALLGLDIHAVPIDTRSVGALAQSGVVDAKSAPEEIGAALERAVRAGEAREAHRVLQAWCDEGSSVVIRGLKGAPVGAPVGARVSRSARAASKTPARSPRAKPTTGRAAK